MWTCRWWITSCWVRGTNISWVEWVLVSLCPDLHTPWTGMRWIKDAHQYMNTPTNVLIFIMTAVPGWLGELISLVFSQTIFCHRVNKWPGNMTTHPPPTCIGTPGCIVLCPEPNLHVCAEGLGMRLLGMAWCKAVHWSVNTEFRSLQSIFQAGIWVYQ